MPADSNAVRHLITAPIKQLPRSFRVLCVFPTRAVVISQIIGVVLGESGAEKRMCQTGHQFPPRCRSELHHFLACEEVQVPTDQAFIF